MLKKRHKTYNTGCKNESKVYSRKIVYNHLMEMKT